MVIRKNTNAMTTQEKARFVSVLSQLISAPEDPNPYGNHVSYHREHHLYRMHPQSGPEGVQRFLPWHRVFLLKTEKMGQEIDEEFFIPYWDWRTEQEVPAWLVNFRPIIRIPGDDIAVVRNPPRLGVSLPTSTAIDGVNHATTFTDFTFRIDPPHGAVHNWANGTLSNFNDSPCDPLFWLHHAMLDKVWAEWQATHANQNPSLEGKWRVMTPWTEDVDQVLNIENLGYQYQ